MPTGFSRMVKIVELIEFWNPQPPVDSSCAILGSPDQSQGLAPASVEVVNFISPQSGTIVRPGELIQVVFSVSANTGSASAMLFVGGQIDQITGTSGSFSTSYQVPADAIGTIEISAKTLDLGASNLSGSTYIVAVPSTPPASLSPKPGAINLSFMGQETNLKILGVYTGGATVDLTMSATGTIYTTLSGINSVVNVSSDGVVQAIANGQETIIIQNGGQVASVIATVNFTNIRPTLNPLVDVVAPQGQIVNIPLVASDPDGNILMLGVANLPPFVNLVDNLNGTGSLVVSPGVSDAGTYEIFVSVMDNGSPELGASRGFQLTVPSTNRRRGQLTGD